MAEEGETGHVRAGVDAVLHHHVAGGLIERRHQADSQRLAVLGQKISLFRRRENADAKRLCKKQHVAGLRAGVREDFVRVDKAGHGQPVFRLVVIDRVAAGDERPGLIDLVVAAAQDLMHGFLRHGLRHGHDVEAELRLTAHGVDVGQRIRRCDLAEGIRVVRDGREEIDRLHERKLVRHLIDRRIVALVESDEQIFVLPHTDIAQQLRENARADLRAAPGAFCKLCQLDLVLHGYTPSVFFPVAAFRTPVYSRIACKTPPPMAMALSEAV